MNTKTLKDLTPQEAYRAGYQEGHSHGRGVSGVGLMFWTLFCICAGALAPLLFTWARMSP